jgi:hypothetical protein
VISKSLVALRSAVQDLQNLQTPSKLACDRVTVAADTLSGCISALSRHVNFDKLLPPDRSAPTPRPGPDLLEVAAWLHAAIDHPPCPRCCNPVRQPDPPPTTTDHELAEMRARSAKLQGTYT